MKQKNLIISLTMVVLMTTIFTACSSTQTVEETKVSETVTPKEEVAEEEPTAEPTAEPTVEPTPEPTADPVETLTALREEALAEHSHIVEQVQYRFDIALELLEVAKGYPNFQENDNYELVLSVISNFEDNVEEGDIEEIVGSSNSLNIAISILLAEYPDLKTTEEFKKLVEAPQLDIAIYNGKADVYNSALSNSATSEFEELPYCLSIGEKLEY